MTDFWTVLVWYLQVCALCIPLMVNGHQAQNLRQCVGPHSFYVDMQELKVNGYLAPFWINGHHTWTECGHYGTLICPCISLIGRLVRCWVVVTPSRHWKKVNCDFCFQSLIAATVVSWAEATGARFPLEQRRCKMWFSIYFLPPSRFSVNWQAFS